MSFQGFVELGADFELLFQSVNTSSVPVDADALPAYRVYGQSGVVASGTAEFKDSGTVTGTTGNGVNPIVVTSASHGLTTGTLVTIASVGGNTNANGTFVVTRINANTFSVVATGNGAYTSGGTWHATGLYDVPLSVTEGNGFDSEAYYQVAIDYKVSGSSRRQLACFGVN